jgi:F0F1-type ATP synthase epsilon subunit
MDTKETFTTIVMSPQKVVWEGEVRSLSSQNSEGFFDIFPDHARFMTLLREAPLTLMLASGEEKVVAIKEAVLFFEESKATVYVHDSVAL